MDNNSLNNLEKLHQLKQNGVITDDEFDAEKAKLLQRGSTSANLDVGKYISSFTGDLPAESDFWGWMTMPLRRYADFSGRSRRKEYWLYGLGCGGIYLALFVLGALMGAFSDGSGVSLGIWAVLLIVVGLGLIVPNIAVAVRRLHDQDKSGWFFLINFIPYVGGIIFLVLMCLDGSPHDNRFGADPKGR